MIKSFVKITTSLAKWNMLDSCKTCSNEADDRLTEVIVPCLMQIRRTTQYNSILPLYSDWFRLLIYISQLGDLRVLNSIINDLNSIHHNRLLGHSLLNQGVSGRPDQT